MITKKQLIESLMANNLPDDTPVLRGNGIGGFYDFYEVTIQSKIYKTSDKNEIPFAAIVLI